MKTNQFIIFKGNLKVLGITPCTDSYTGEKWIRFEVGANRFHDNVYIKCLYEILWHWDDAYYFIDALINEGIVKQNDDFSLEWGLNKTSLAWLFWKMYHYYEDRKIDEFYKPITGGFWHPVETLFRIKRGSLKKLLHIKRTYAGKPSSDIEKLKAILKKYNYHI